MSTQQLSYLTLKSVIQYIEPNLRLSLSRRCPSLQLVDKSTCFYINNLNIDQNSIRINNTLYRLRVIRSNGDNGRPYDVDEYGYEDLVQEVDLDFDEIQIDNRIRPRSPQKSMEELIGSFGSHELRSRVLRDGPYFDNYIQLVAGRVIEEVKYYRKLHDALKYLLDCFLGGRKCCIVVRKFCVGSVGILRIPIDIKLKVQHMKVPDQKTTNDSILRPISSILSGTLETLEISHYTPEVRRKFREIHCLIFNFPLLYNFGIIPHQRVHCKSTSFASYEHIVQLVKNWVENYKDKRAWYSFDFEKECQPKSVLNKVRINHEDLWRKGFVEEGKTSTQMVNLFINKKDVLSIFYEQKENLWVLNIKMLN